MLGRRSKSMTLAWGYAMLILLPLILAPTPGMAIDIAAGNTAPDFTVSRLGGGSVSLHDYRGQVTMIMFWSSWCSKCREELEFLKAMKARYSGVNFLAINAETEQPQEKDIARVKQAVEEWKLPFVIGVDEGLKVWSLYGIKALPTIVIIGREGSILFTEANFHLGSPEAIDKTLAVAFSKPEPG